MSAKGSANETRNQERTSDLERPLGLAPETIADLAANGVDDATIGAACRQAAEFALANAAEAPEPPRSRWDELLGPRVVPFPIEATRPPAGTAKTVVSSTERSRRRRAELRKLGLPNSYRGSIEAARAAATAGNVAAVAGNVSGVAGNLALISVSESLSIKSLNQITKRESSQYQGEHMPAVAGNDLPTSLLADWQPTADGWQLAVERLGEVIAANSLANFRDYFGALNERQTPQQWQARWRKWVRNERVSGTQGRLPRIRNVTTEPAASSVTRPTVDPAWRPIFDRLENAIGAKVADAWFGRSTLREVQGETAVIAMATKHACSYAMGNYEGAVVRAVAAQYHGVRRVRFVVDAEPTCIAHAASGSA